MNLTVFKRQVSQRQKKAAFAAFLSGGAGVPDVFAHGADAFLHQLEATLEIGRAVVGHLLGVPAAADAEEARRQAQSGAGAVGPARADPHRQYPKWFWSQLWKLPERIALPGSLP